MINIITQEEFEKFEKRLFDKLLTIIEKKDYLTKEDCFELYGIKERTLTTLRDNRKITFSKVGNTCLYKYSSLIDYIDKNSIKSVA